MNAHSDNAFESEQIDVEYPDDETLELMDIVADLSDDEILRAGEGDAGADVIGGSTAP